MSSCFSRCLRVPIAIRAFYESYLWILQTLLLTHPDLHPGLLASGTMAALNDFPGRYCYFASQWEEETTVPIVLLEKPH